MTSDVDGVTSLFIDGGVGWNNPTREADLLIREKPFKYKASEELIVVSLGTGGALFTNYSDTARDKVRAVNAAVTECRTTAEDMHKQYNNIDNVQYYRFDPDAVGRYDMDDAKALNNIQNEVAIWCTAEVHDKMHSLARRLTEAVTKTNQVIDGCMLVTDTHSS
jgi:hypothetical protein